jgi:hypothetical protein
MTGFPLDQLWAALRSAKTAGAVRRRATFVRLVVMLGNRWMRLIFESALISPQHLQTTC